MDNNSIDLILVLAFFFEDELIYINWILGDEKYSEGSGQVRL